jgi:putative tryptophan/tyrosine transport system substrate-binding protein
MRDLGYVEGQNVEIAYRFGNFDRARLPALAEELVRLNPHLISLPPTPLPSACGRRSKTSSPS